MKGGGCTTTWCTKMTLEEIALMIANTFKDNLSMPTEQEVMDKTKTLCSSEKGSNPFFCSNYTEWNPSRREYYDVKMYKHPLRDIVTKTIENLKKFGTPLEKESPAQVAAQQIIDEKREQTRKEQYLIYVKRVLEYEKQECAKQIDAKLKSYLDDKGMYSSWLDKQSSRGGTRKSSVKCRSRKVR
jgi:hypothetical protein